jgi:hypothetical protein
MLTDTLPLNAASSYETSPSRLPRAIVPLLIERRGKLRHAAAPASPAMNSRRRICHPSFRCYEQADLRNPYRDHYVATVFIIPYWSAMTAPR